MFIEMAICEALSCVGAFLEALTRLLIARTFFDCPHQLLSANEIQPSVQNFSDSSGKPLTAVLVRMPRHTCH